MNTQKTKDHAFNSTTTIDRYFYFYVILVDRGGTNSFKFKISCKFMLIPMSSLHSFDPSIDDTLLDLAELESKENCFCLQSLVSNDTHRFLSFVTYFKIHFLILLILFNILNITLFKNYLNFRFFILNQS